MRIVARKRNPLSQLSENIFQSSPAAPTAIAPEDAGANAADNIFQSLAHPGNCQDAAMRIVARKTKPLRRFRENIFQSLMDRCPVKAAAGG
ncbi:hypothetical protein ACNPON_17315, partial [Glutamicibacter sp. AGC13]